MKDIKMGMGRRGKCGDCQASCMKMTGGSFIEVCRRTGLKVNAGKSKVMD